MASTPDPGVVERLSEQLTSVFDGGAAAQRAYYEAHPDQRPGPTDIDRVISYYANVNAAISGGLSLVPGPWGMLAAIPEVVVVVRNQVKMVYDIGIASGKTEEVMSRELLLGVTMSATGVGTIGLLTMQGGKVLVKRTSLRVFQRLVALFAGKVTQQLLKSMVAKWLPVIGAGAIAAWTRYSTVVVGRKAREIFACDITVQPDDDHLLEAGSTPPAPTPEVVVTQRILLLANLMKVDGTVAAEEAGYLEAMLVGAGLGADATEALRKQIAEPNQHPVDHAVFDADERVSVLMDLVALANRDGVVHPAERLFLRQVARRFEVPDADVDALLA